MRTLLGLLSTLGWLTSLGSARPHIVFFLADDYGWADISYHGRDGNRSNIIDTPNLDRLASKGVKLENYYVQPVCSPTRATIMTGRYTISHGIHTPLVDSSPSGLALEEVTLAQKLKEAGYATHMVGKWHLGFYTWAHTPQERGFDSYYGYYAGSTDYYNHESLCWAGSFADGCFQKENNGTAVTGLDLHSNYDTVSNASGQYSTILFTEKAEDIVRAHAKQHADDSVPLFLYVAHQAVHVANKPDGIHDYWLDQAPAEWIAKYSWVQNEERRNLSAMVGVMDESAGNLTRTLAEVGMWDNTIFIFSTDNGGPTNQKASNFPFRGGKASVWEGGVHGTGFVSGGDLASVGVSVAGGYRNRQLMHVSDWLPTLCDVAGCKLNGTLPLDGISQWASIAHNATTARTELLHEMYVDNGGRFNGRAALRLGDYKLVVGQGGGPKNGNAAFLFNIATDAGENTDLATSLPDKLAELNARLQYWANRTQHPHDKATPDPRSNPNLHGGRWEPYISPAPPGPAPPSSCTFVADMDYWPSTHKKMKASSAEDCCELCAAMPLGDCTVAVWASPHGCYPKPAGKDLAPRARSGSTACIRSANSTEYLVSV